MSLKTAYALSQEDPDAAAKIANDILRDDTENAGALYLLGTVHAKAERFGNALPIFEKVVRLVPRRHEAWNYLGMCQQECHEFDKSNQAFRKAIDWADKAKSPPETTANYLANLASSYSGQGNYSEAIRWCKRALEKDPEHSGALTTLGFAQIATGDWQNGWKGYENCLGGRFRKIVQLGDEPKWDGSYVENLFVYGEQGLGDELMYASCLEDIKAGHITLECDPRLEGLFKRSFPHIEVHGTRRKDPYWAEGKTFDAGCAIGSLPALFRPTRESCPKKPYLIADAERRLQWRALFDSWGKPVIGIGWTGGRAATQAKARKVGLEAFRPIIESVDAVFVSVQYIDPREEIDTTGLPVRHLPRAVQSPDYDDTAAFVAELDYLIAPPTTIHHMAGAMGKSSLILVPSQPMWDCAYSESWPWYQEQKFFRQKKDETWADCLRRLNELRIHWLRPEAASRVQRASALDCETC